MQNELVKGKMTPGGVEDVDAVVVCAICWACASS